MAVVERWTEPVERVSRRWVASVSLANLGLFMAYFGPLGVLLPNQVQAIAGQDHKVVAFGWVTGLGALVMLAGQHTIAGVVVGWCLAQAGMNAMQAGIVASVPDQVPVSQRGAVSGWLGVPQVVGVIIAVFLVTMVMPGNRGYLLLAVLAVGCTVPFMAGVRDPELMAGVRDPERFRGPRGGLAAEWVGPLRDHDFGWAWLTRFLMVLGNSVAVLYLLYLLYFLRDRVRYSALFPGQTAEDGLVKLLLVYTAVVVVTAVASGVMSDRSGRRRHPVVVSGVVMAVPAVLLALWPTWPVVLAASGLLGLGFGVYLACGHLSRRLHRALPLCRRDRSARLGGGRTYPGCAVILSCRCEGCSVTTLADLFAFHYRTNCAVDFSGIRLHAGADRVCAVFGAQALTVGADIFFRSGAFAPHTPEGLRLLAHEVAHVVQQRRGAVPGTAMLAKAGGVAGLAVAPAGGFEEQEAEAAADALVAGQSFVFSPGRGRRLGGAAVGAARPLVVQRYMAWEHGMLGDMEPGLLGEAAGLPVDRRQQLDAYCALLEDLGRDPRNVDEERLRAEYPGVETLRLPGSGLIVTLGELNVLPDYLARPADIETAPAAFLEPLLQSVRSWSIAELRQSAGRPGPRRLLRGSLRYPKRRRLAEIMEAVEVDALGERCGFAPWDLYSSVVARNAGHFAPFSWHRWQSFHLMARELIFRAWAESGDERDTLITRARIYAGYADHFLQDSYAAGHLINKTLVMQWYIEWLAASPIGYLDRPLLARMTTRRQPLLHGPGCYERADSGCDGQPRDPQTASEAPTLELRVAASGVAGDSAADRRDAYAAYLAMLGSSVAQLAAGTVHGYLNRHSLVVAAGADGSRVRLHGDWTLLADGGGAAEAARASAASRRAISELLNRGGTSVTSQEIFARFPDHVEQDGELVPLRRWHETGLRDLCVDQLFGAWRTRATRIFLSAVSPRLGVPSADLAALRERVDRE